MTFGFILTRHVNSHKTNKYWIRSVTLINALYPAVPIIIIDDNSKTEFLTRDAETNLKNITVINSEYPGRGELLPFIYLLKHRWFNAAVIMHDSVFIHKKINFETGAIPDVLPLWHFPYNNASGRDDFHHIMYISRFLANANIIQKKLQFNNNKNNLVSSMSLIKKQDVSIFNLCFGVQTYIKLPFLDHIEKKYKITNLLQCIQCRRDRCALERIMGCIFHTENRMALSKRPSVFGHILRHKQAYKYAYQNYMQDVVRKKIPGYFVKVWSGR